MAPQANILMFFIDFSIENTIFECGNVKIFACGALEGGRSSKNLIKPLILVKIGAEGAENFWGRGARGPRFFGRKTGGAVWGGPDFFAPDCNTGRNICINCT